MRGGELRVVGRVPENLKHFVDHFPSNSVLPAYVQIEWLMEEVENAFEIATTPCRIRRVKFNQVLRPGDEFSLTAQWDPPSGRLSFTVIRAGDTAASGIIEIDSS